MREIKFRVKTVDNEWHYGFPQVYSDGSCDFYELIKEYISSIYTSERFREVYKECKKETLGQYTGLKDKNGKEIYEGDIIEFNENEWGCKHIEPVEYDFEYLDMRKNDFNQWCEVIGNIYDNPELLEGK